LSRDLQQAFGTIYSGHRCTAACSQQRRVPGSASYVEDVLAVMRAQRIDRSLSSGLKFLGRSLVFAGSPIHRGERLTEAAAPHIGRPLRDTLSTYTRPLVRCAVMGYGKVEDMGNVFGQV
jgi:hypothetical protein